MPFVPLHDNTVLEKVPHQPKHEPTNKTAKALVPKFLYRDASDTSIPEIQERLYGERQKLKIVVLGAGISTLNFLHYLFESIPKETIELTVYEKNSDVGGAWLTTTYPGVRSDIPGPGYQFPWRKHVWTQFYPPGAETCDYLQTVARENDFYRFMHFKHEVIRASWADEDLAWRLNIHDIAGNRTFEEHADLFIELTGPISSPKITLPGIEYFKGEVVHSGAWRNDIDLNGKRVALLGYGSSGVQIAPNIINQVERLYTWYRSRLYLNPPLLPELAAAEGVNFAYTEEQKALLQDDEVYQAYCKELDGLMNMHFPLAVNGHPMAEKVKELVGGYMRSKLAPKPGLVEQILPEDFDVGCRRPTLCHGYLEAIADPKTTVFLEEPNKFTATGFIDGKGEEHEVDIVIAATGYDQEHKPRYPKIVNGIDMGEKWAADLHPRSYMAVCLEDMPNYFNAGSAYAPVAGSWYRSSEATTKYMVKMIDKMQLEHLTSFRPKHKAVDHFVRHSNAYMQRMVQTGPCSAWYKGRDGRPRMWPGSTSHYMKCFQRLRGEDFEWTYEQDDDMFSWMGNGFCLDPDGTEGGDSTWYIEKPGKDCSEAVEKLRGVHGIAMPPPNLRERDLDNQVMTDSSAIL